MGQAWQWWYVMYNFVHICAQLFRMTIFHWIEAAATACCKHSPLLRQCVLWLWMQGCTHFTLLWDCSKNILLCWAHLDTKKQNIFLAFHSFIPSMLERYWVNKSQVSHYYGHVKNCCIQTHVTTQILLLMDFFILIFHKI